ncbi:methyl-accepting chemotaxis protein [Shewanella sp. JNE10-2]|uniref:methyl-accepting chemotaxis protein n=1 Tax=unclassified Shewanella TaxID=196818 RepID=UPI0020055CEB|nr:MULTISPECIES: methyl-accepting chemotaxis protein [unclassified Shewanella]MCK7628994.1 methyl-accepting chemotaxis protein [Shewanella sp. JNE9-1]MCK7633484.1 methyl-accepting chemotaxis protein [Shewanella sp. JNE17]MCK7644243.1 methyl-accepting chemotaxis protein [Shewanella sp. JNE3-1]MCK7648757.1 methyl-accepting chemotaxis protein [Shewanella sp. JNE8]MCK7652118.1 methyl-accepting chemotaxis protein [Shewanella sp. JNE4-1]
MLIRSKLLLSAAVSISALIAMFGLQLHSNSVESELSHLAQNILELERDTLILRRNEKDFFVRKDLKYVENHKQVYGQISQSIPALEQIFKKYDVPTQSLDNFYRHLNQYQSTFSEVVKLQQEIGLTPQTGLYGTLRTAVHNVESLLKEYEQASLAVAMLQLRRNEKDFMLRRELRYVETFDTNIVSFNNSLLSSGLDSDIQGRISVLIEQYQKDFKVLVNKEQQLGLTEQDGTMAQMIEANKLTEASAEELHRLALKAIEVAKSSSVNLGMMVFLLITALLSIITYLIIRSIITPVERITQVISRIEQSKDLTLRCDASTQDELGKIAEHFNSMVGSFQQLIEQVIESVATINTSCKHVSENAMLASEGVAQQLNETDMVATAITEMGATIDEIAKTTELAALKAGKTHDNAQSGQLEVEQTIHKIQSLAEQLNSSASVVDELERDSETIGSVLDVIRGIAEQTNLLALNAAIEAARAGEQGRGFAVVADEVRSLAMRTQSSTQEIANIIQTLQSRTRSIVQLMDASQKQGTESAEQAAAAGALLKLINNDVRNIMDMSTQIAAAIEEQSMVAAEVNKNVVVIRDIAEESSKAADANASASDELKAQAEYLYRAVSNFKI